MKFAHQTRACIILRMADSESSTDLTTRCSKLYGFNAPTVRYNMTLSLVAKLLPLAPRQEE